MKTLHLSILFLLILFYQSCGKETDGCPDGVNNFYNLTDEEKNKIPYTGTDTLVFVSNQGDTATLIGQGKKQTYTRTTTGGNPDCGSKSYTYENYEKIEFSFKGSNIDLNNILFVAKRYNSPYDYLSYYDCDINMTDKFNYGILESHDINRYKDTVLYRNNIIKCLKMFSYTDTTTNYYFNNLYGIVKVTTTNKIFIKK
ncbi:MAG: hypothetical protein V4643_12040 [Bacteroidota bacterium]